MAGIPSRITFGDPHDILKTLAPALPAVAPDGATPARRGARRTGGDDSVTVAGAAYASNADAAAPPVAAPDPAWPRWYGLSLRAQSLRVAVSFDRLLAPRALYDRVRPHPYQLRVVEQALREKAPSAILADEVGLGKTIEAGLIYKELALRGIAQSTLILTPKALLNQWQDELRERFDEDFVLTDERRFRGFDQEERIICSLPQFVRSFDRIAPRTWDMLIVDEAHLLANPASKRRQSVSLLRARWRLLLTATPVANRLTDLYSLIDLVAPGRLGSQRDFEDEYVADPGTNRLLRPERAAQLRGVVREVMCRTRRSETDIAFVGRTVDTRAIPPTPAEDALIADVTNYLRALYRRPPTSRMNRGAVIREIMALQQSLSSSPSAIEQSLRRRAERYPEESGELLALADRCREVTAATSAKERLLLDALKELGDEPALIFTLRLDTAARLRDVIRAQGRTADCYVGALSRAEREVMVADFNGGGLNTLIATDAGAEGLNLQQRCHIVFNYDLHWNPMRIEQRIGRVHRLGQAQNVTVFNFTLRDTIDDYVLRLLYQKINLFTMTIGALETVLAETQEEDLDLEERILDILMQSATGDETRRQLNTLGDEIVHALERQQAAESLTSRVLEAHA
ncbi:MAG TPA: SNF2-related protein [Ktedonobacterales bacterium]|nr:SNF2-related protein [Ktedonobacterales bacterium]